MAICLNNLLGALPLTNARNLIKHSKLIQLYEGEVVFESDEDIKHVFFPLDCVFSLFNDDAKKITSINRNGALGTEICLNENLSKTLVLVTKTGWAYKIDKISFLATLNTPSQCPSELMNYAHNFRSQHNLDKNEGKTHKIKAG